MTSIIPGRSTVWASLPSVASAGVRKGLPDNPKHGAPRQAQSVQRRGRACPPGFRRPSESCTFWRKAQRQVDWRTVLISSVLACWSMQRARFKLLRHSGRAPWGARLNRHGNAALGHRISKHGKRYAQAENELRKPLKTGRRTLDGKPEQENKALNQTA